MNDDLDALLSDGLLQPPADFGERVMKNIQRFPHGTLLRTPRTNLSSLLRRLAAVAAVAGAGALGLSQLASFILGLWLASAAL